MKISPIYYTIIGFVICLVYVNIQLKMFHYDSLFQDLRDIKEEIGDVEINCNRKINEKNNDIKVLEKINSELMHELGEYNI